MEMWMIKRRNQVDENRGKMKETRGKLHKKVCWKRHNNGNA